jgi:hypothetical protein
MDPQLAERVETERQRLAQRFTAEQWDKRIESNSKHIQIVLFNGIIRDAKRWLYEQPAASATEMAAAMAGGSELPAEEPEAQPGDSDSDPSDSEKTLN